AVEAFDRIPIPMASERMLLGVLLEFLGDRQRPVLVAIGGELLEPRQRISELRLIIGTTERESLSLHVFIEVCKLYCLLAIECGHAHAKVKTRDVAFQR